MCERSPFEARATGDALLGLCQRHCLPFFAFNSSVLSENVFATVFCACSNVSVI